MTWFNLEVDINNNQKQLFYRVFLHVPLHGLIFTICVAKMIKITKIWKII